MHIWDLIGWIGSILYIGAYLGLALGRLRAETYVYHSINMVAGFGVMLNAVHYQAYPGAFLNLAWILIGIFALYRIQKDSPKRPTQMGPKRSGIAPGKRFSKNKMNSNTLVSKPSDT